MAMLKGPDGMARIAVKIFKTRLAHWKFQSKMSNTAEASLPGKEVGIRFNSFKDCWKCGCRLLWS